jgi:hypothetical protein
VKNLVALVTGGCAYFSFENVSIPVLPDGLFSNQKSQFG